MLNIPWRTRCQRPWLPSKLSFCGRCLSGGLIGGHENQCKRLKNANFKVSSNEGRILPCQSFSSLWSLEGVVGINIKVSDSQAFAYLISIFSIKKYLKHYLVTWNWKKGKIWTCCGPSISIVAIFFLECWPGPKRSSSTNDSSSFYLFQKDKERGKAKLLSGIANRRFWYCCS